MNESVGRLPASDHAPMQNGGLAAGVAAQSPLRHSPAAHTAAPLSAPPQLARSPLQSPPPPQNVRTYIRPLQKASPQEHHSQQLGTAAQPSGYSHGSQLQPRDGAAPSAYGNILQSQLTQQRKPPPAVVSTYSSGQQQAVSRAAGQPTRAEQKLSPIQQTIETVRTKMQQHVQDLQQHQQQQQRAAPLQHVQQQQRLSALHQHQRPTPLQQQQQQQQMQQRRHTQIQVQQQHPPQLQQQQQHLQQRQPSHLQQQQQQQQRRLTMHAITQQVKQSTQRVAQSMAAARQPGEGQLLDHQYDMESGAVPAQTANPSQQRHYPANTHSSQQRLQVASQQRQPPQQRQRVVSSGNFQSASQPQRSYPAPPNVGQRQQQQVQVQQVHQVQQQVFELFEQPLQATVIHQPQFNQQAQPQQFALVRQEEVGSQSHYVVSPRQQQQHYDTQSVVIVDGVPQAATVQYVDQHAYDVTAELETETSGGRVFLVGSDGGPRPTATPLRRQVARARGRGDRPSRGAHGGHHPHLNHNQPRMAPPSVAAAPAAGQNLGMVDLRNVSIEFEDSEMIDAPPVCSSSGTASTELDLLAQACTEAAVDELAMCSSSQTHYVNVALTATSAAQRPPAGHAHVVSGQVVGSVAGQIVGSVSGQVVGSVAGQLVGSVAGQRTVAAGVRPVGGHEVRYVSGAPLSAGQVARVTSGGQPQLAPGVAQGRVATPGPAPAPTATPKKKYSLSEYNEMRKQTPPSRTDQVEFVFNPETGRYLAYKQAGASSPAPQQLKGQLAGQIAAVLDKTLVQTRVGSGASSPATCTTATEKSAEVYTPRLVPGKLAICSNCGTCSSDFNRCDFCKKALPASPKTVEVTKTLLAAETTSTTTSVRVQVASAPAPTRNRPPPPKPTPPPKRARPRRRDNEEPVCLTISSDEEDAAAAPSSPTLEPVLTPSEADPGAAGDGSLSGDELATRGVLGGGKPVAESDADWEREIQGVDDGSLAGSYLSERVRAVRVGSYRPPADEPVLFSTRGTRLRLPTAAPPHRQVALTVPPSCVHRLLAHLGSQLMVVFLYLTPSSGGHVRRLLEMTDPSSAYFDPASPEEMHKRITIIFQDDMSDESRLVLMEVFRASLGEERVLEIPLSEANKILVRASPPQLAATLMASCDANTVQTLLQFPPPPASGAIAVTTDDYCCLEEEQFLNDVIIDFYLKYLVQSRLSEADRKRTHVFSSFFYKRLTTRPRYRQGRRPAEESAKVTAAEKRHARVKGWTKNVDIFDMDFLIVPINEHSHWFLAIICFPGLEGYRRLKDGQPCPPPLPRRMRPAEPPPPDHPKAAAPAAAGSAQAQPIQIGSTLITPLPADPVPVKREPEAESLDDEDSDRDEADGDDEDLDAEVEGGDAADGAEKESPPPEAEGEEGCGDSAEAECELETGLPAVCTDQVPETAVKQPCVLIFDSLAGASRTRVVATLREYLRIEYQVKKSAQRLFNKDTIPGYCAKVPQQNNFSDCGVYVLQYVESFFESPILDYHMPLLPLHSWFPIARARRKREQIARLIERLARRQNPAHNIVLPKLLFNSSPEMKKLLEEEQQQQQQERWASPAKGGRAEPKSRGAKPAPAPAMVPRQVGPVMKIVRHAGPQGGKLVVKQILVQSPRAAAPANPMLKPASGAAAAELGRPAKTVVVPPSPTPRPPISRTTHVNVTAPKPAVPTVKSAAPTVSVASSSLPRPETSPPSPGTSGAAPRQQSAASTAAPQPAVSKTMPTALKAPSGALVPRPGAVSSPPTVRASKQAAPQPRPSAAAAPATARAAETATPSAAVKQDAEATAASKPDKAPQTAPGPAHVASQPPERRAADTRPTVSEAGELPEEPAVSASSAVKGVASCGGTPAPPAADCVQATHAVEKRSPAATKAADAAPSEPAAQERKPPSKPSTPGKVWVSSSPLKLASAGNTPKLQVVIDKVSDAEAIAASSPKAERAVRKTNGADTGPPTPAPRVPSRVSETVSQAGTNDNTVSPQVSVSPSKAGAKSPKASVSEAAAGVRSSVSRSPTPSRTSSRARGAAGGAPSAAAVTRSRGASGESEPAAALVTSAGLSAIAAGYASSSDDDAGSTASTGEDRTSTPDPQEGGLRRRAPRDYALMAGQKRRTATPTPKDAVKEKVARKS